MRSEKRRKGTQLVAYTSRYKGIQGTTVAILCLLMMINNYPVNYNLITHRFGYQLC